MSDESCFYSPGEIPENEKENDDGHLVRNLMTDFQDQDEVKPTSSKSSGNREPIKVYLRVRPFSCDEMKASEDQGCLKIVDDKTVLLSAPRDSFTFKSSIRGIAEQNHQFSFSKVYDESVTQKDIFDDAMLAYVKDFLDGVNCLIFTYGVTNSGKTFTIQGNPKNSGILPRALDVLFNSIKGKQYDNINLKPTMYQDVTRLSQEQQHYEEVLKKAVVSAGQKDNIDLSILWKMNATSQSDMSVISTTSTASSSYVTANDEDYSSISDEIKERVCDGTVIDVNTQGPVKFSIWVSFAEIYNEYVYDLLDPAPLGKGKKRPVLKLGDDKKGNPYIKGLRQIQVNSADEAFKVLRVGQKNQNIAATKLNQNSSRSHSIFTIKTLRVVDVDEPHVARISRLSFVDLAGSERYCKTQSTGDRLKEASNINTSIMTLGKCIEYLRYNQQHKNHPLIIPFRENKLTRLFQGFFLGKGKACMVVNISQCASVFDETYNVLKFSAVAKQVTTKSVRNTEFFKPKMPKPSLSSATPVNKLGKRSMISVGLTTPRPIQKDIMFESMSDGDERFQLLVKSYEDLRKQLVDEKRKNAVMELKIREEVCTEMSEQIVEIERNYSERLQEEHETMEEMCERRIEMLTKSMKKARKKRKMESNDTDEDSHVSNVLLNAEKVKVKERDEVIRSLRAKLAEKEIAHEFYKQTHTPEQHPKVIKRLQNELEEAKETVKVNENHIEDLQTTLNHTQDVLEEKEIEVEKLKEVVELTESKNELIEMRNLLQATSNALEEARLKLDLRDERLKEKDDVIAQFKDKLASMQDNMTEKLEMEEFGRELARLEEQGKLLHERNEYQNSEMQQLRLEKDDIDAQRKLIGDKVEELKRQLAESEDRREQLQFKDEEQNKKIKRFVDIVNNQETALADSEALIEQLNEKIKQMKAESEEVDRKVDETRNQWEEEGEISGEDDEIVFKSHAPGDQVFMGKEKEEVADLEKEKNEFEKEIEDCRVKILDCEKELLGKQTQLESERSVYEKELKSIKSNVEDLNKALESKEDEMDVMRGNHLNEMENLEEKYEDREKELVVKIEEYEKRIQRMKTDIECFNEKIVCKDNEIEKQRIEFETQLKAQRVDFEAKIHSLETRATETVVKSSFGEKSRVSTLKGVKPKMKAECLLRGSASSPRSPYKSNYTALKEMEKALKETSTALDKKNEQVLVKNKRISELEKKVKALEDEIEILSEEKFDLVSKLDESRANIEELNGRVEEFSYKLVEVKEDLTNSKNAEAKREEEYLKIRKESEMLRDKGSALEKTLEQYKQKIEDLEASLDEEKLNFGKQSEELNNLSKEKENFRLENLNLRKQLIDVDAMKEDLALKQNEMEALKVKIKDFENLEESVNDLRSLNIKLEDSLKEKAKEAEEMRNSHEKETSNLKSDVIILKKEHASLLDEIASKNSDLRSKIVELNNVIEENVELKSSLCKANEMVSSLELLVKLREKEKELDSMHTKHEVVKALAKASKKEDEMIKEMAERGEQRDQIIELQKKQLKEQQNEIEDLQEKIEESRNVNRDLVKKAQTIHDLRCTIIKKDEKLKEMSELELKVTDLETKLKEYDEVIFQKETLTMQVETQKRGIRDRDQEVSSARKKIERIQEELKNSKAEIQKLRTELVSKEEQANASKFQTPKATPGSERSRKRSSDIPLSELKDAISSDKKGLFKSVQSASLRRSTRTRISSLKKGSADENDPVSEELSSASKKKKRTERTVLFELNEQPSDILQADTPESPKPGKKPRRRKLLAKNVGICAESPQVIPPSPTREDEVTAIVKRQLRSTSRR